VELASRSGTRREPLASLLRGNRVTARRPDELLTAVIIPRVLERGRSAFVKLGARRYLVISVAMAAAVVEADEAGLVRDARVAVGSCSAVARRLPDLERILIGRPARPGLGRAVLPEHGAPLSPIDDVRADRRLPHRRRAHPGAAGARILRRRVLTCISRVRRSPSPSTGRPVAVSALPTSRLSAVLRDDLGLSGTKNGCDAAIAAPARCCSTEISSAPASSRRARRRGARSRRSRA
jgi:xanthine dehydrogenase iron-sulfur cluster and FAD-binding subunit A